jgi:hypothetical protein
LSSPHFRYRRLRLVVVVDLVVVVLVVVAVAALRTCLRPQQAAARVVRDRNRDPPAAAAVHHHGYWQEAGGEERLRTYCWVELSSKPPVLFVVESQPFGTGDSLSSSNRRHVFSWQLLVFFFSRNNEKRDLFLRRELVNHPFQTWTNLRMLIQINE